MRPGTGKTPERAGSGREAEMKYRVVVFGVKDTTAEIVSYIQEKLQPVDLVVTIHSDVLSGNQVSGYKGLSYLTE